VEVDDVRIDVVEQCPLRHEPERNCQATTEWLDEPLGRVTLPVVDEMRHLPTLAAGPLERRLDCLGCRRALFCRFWGYTLRLCHLEQTYYTMWLGRQEAPDQAFVRQNWAEFNSRKSPGKERF